MTQLRLHGESDVRIQAVLEACAGLALACAYSSSAEYEAEVIQVRRDGGAYGPLWHRQAFVAVALAGSALGIVALGVWIVG